MALSPLNPRQNPAPEQWLSKSLIPTSNAEHRNLGTEIELKFAISKSGLKQVMALPWLKRIAGDNRKQELVSVYFDTPDLALRDHAVTLRVRRRGEQRLQTIKANSRVPMTRSEWEAEIDQDCPRLELARHTALAPILTDKVAKHLKPVFETRIERTVMPLQVGRSEIELALDHGRVATARDSIEIAEIEIELKEGECADVARLARKLADEVPVMFAPGAKAERGYALLEGTVNASISAEAVALAPSATTADAFAIIGFCCLRQIAGNEFAVRQGDPEGIHQMRVGLRRLRAAISLFKDMLPRRKTSGIKNELKWLTEQLGPSRDIDVLIGKTVAPYLSHHPDRSEFKVLAHHLEGERDGTIAKARAAVESDRFRNLLLDCALWFIDGEWRSDTNNLKRAVRERSAKTFAEEELARRIRKVVKRVRKLERLDAMKRHKLRIAVKKVRYAREFFASVYPDGRRRKTRRKVDGALKLLQSALGRLNDMRVHMHKAHDFARANTASRKAFAVGYLAGREEARAGDVLREALGAGKQLRKAA
jgi:triphosphatase